MKKRNKFYLGLIILLVAVILLTILVIQGPHTRIPETTREAIYDSPNGPSLPGMRQDDSVEFKFESSKPVNVILMREKDSGKYFNLDERKGFEYYILASEETAGSFKHTFNSSGDWKIYIENPTPPSPTSANPSVTYWGKIISEEDDMLFYYMNISICVILLILAFALLLSSRTQKKNSKKDSKPKK